MENYTSTKTAKRRFIASCFIAPSGRFLSLAENHRYTSEIYAEDEEDAWEQVAELEQVDSEIPISDRWGLY